MVSPVVAYRLVRADRHPKAGAGLSPIGIRMLRIRCERTVNRLPTRVPVR
jgi:hypothetical protein